MREDTQSIRHYTDGLLYSHHGILPSDSILGYSITRIDRPTSNIFLIMLCSNLCDPLILFNFYPFLLNHSFLLLILCFSLLFFLLYFTSLLIFSLFFYSAKYSIFSFSWFLHYSNHILSTQIYSINTIFPLSRLTNLIAVVV